MRIPMQGRAEPHARPDRIIAVACLGLVSFSSVALSQELEEVVVTAQRVESTAQETPIAIDVLSGQQIQDRGIASVQDLAQISPSLNIAGEGGGIMLTIRGVSSRDGTEIGDPAVVLSIDGFYQDQGQAFGLTQYDLERIEVLRGPQGTLYGRNATGGAVNVYTRRPQPDYEGYGLIELGNYGAVNAQGAVNIPLTDRTFMRASFGTQNHLPYRDGGYFGGFQDAYAASGRLQFGFHPNDNLDIRIAAQLTNQSGTTNVPYQVPYSVLPVEAACPLAGGDGPCQRVDHSFLVEPSDPLAYESPGDTFIWHDEKALRWDLEWRLPATTVTYIGGWNDLDYSGRYPSWNWATPAGTTPGVPQYYQQHEDVETINQEVRFSSADPSSRFTYQAGLYYFKSDNDLDSISARPDGTDTPPTNIHFLYQVPIESLAYFAHFDYDLSDDLELSIGARHNSDKKDRSGNIIFAQYPPPGLPPNHDPGSDQDKDTYSVGLTWGLSDDSMAYAKFDTGYKNGGFTDNGPYGPEEIETIEFGSKNRFLNNQLQLNFAVYQSDYTGQQVQQIVESGGGLRIENAGETRYQGIETELIYATDNGRLDFGLNLLDSEFTTFDLAYGEPVFNVTAQAWENLPTVNADLEGNVPQQAPDVSATLGYRYTFDAWGGELTAGFSAKYQSEQYFTFFNRPDDRQASYSRLDLLFTYQRDNAPWQIQLYGNNVTDEVIALQLGPNDRSKNYANQYQPPATYGLRFRYDW